MGRLIDQDRMLMLITKEYLGDAQAAGQDWYIVYYRPPYAANSSLAKKEKD